MKNTFDGKKLPMAVGVLGALGFVLRFVLYAVAVDEKNLLVRGHPLTWVLWLVTALAAVLIVWTVAKLGGSNRYMDNFASSRRAALGAVFFAAGIGLTVLSGGMPETRLEQAGALVGILSVPALAAIAVCRKKGEKPHFLLYCTVCLYLALYMVNHYRPWSGDPQMQDYIFHLLCVACLTMFAYYQSAFVLELGKRKKLLFVGLLGAFTGITAAAHGENDVLYLTGALWCLTNLCTLEPVPEAEPKEDGQ